MAYTKTNWVNDDTELNAENMNHIEDGIYNSQNVEIIAISDEAPTSCVTGDKYYNTEDNLIYTATATDTWSEDGEEPIRDVFYILFSEQSSYSYDGTTLVSVGGGTEDIVISDEEPTEEGVKIWIDTGEISQQASEITNSYSTSTGIGYSANYVNNNVGVVESGSNTNGSYIKFSDGTMICYSKEAKANIPINTSDGSLYKSADLSLQDFPQTFYSVPTINTFITNNNWSIICIGRPSTSTVTVSNPGSINVYKTTSTGTGVVAFYVNTIAIGRWK